MTSLSLSLLNFIKGELRSPTPTTLLVDQPWVVDEFNAWRHQRFGAPCWGRSRTARAINTGGIALRPQV